MRYRNGNLISSADASPSGLVSGGLYNLISQQIFRQGNRWPNSDVVITQNLIFHLDAGDSSSYPGTGTTWTDLSGSNNGTLVNGPVFDSNNSGSIDFDGSNDYVQFNSPMFNPNSDFTFNSWINPDSIPTSGARTIVSENNGTGRLQIAIVSSGVRIVKNFVGGLATFANSTLTAQTWVNVCVVRSSNTYSLYLDGTFVSSFTSTQTFTAGPDAIGFNNGIEYFNGKISVVAAYDRALSASEILQNYNALNVRY